MPDEVVEWLREIFDAHGERTVPAGLYWPLTYDVLGAMLPADVQAQAAAELADTLREIDESQT